MKKILFILLFFPFVVFSQNKLKNAKENMSKQSSSKENVHKEEAVTSPVTTERESIGEAVATAVVTSVAAPIISGVVQVVYFSTLGIVLGTFKVRDLAKYPYYNGVRGEYTKNITTLGKRQNLKLGVNYLPNRVSGLELNAVFKPIPIIGIDASYNHFSEKNLKVNESLDKFSLIGNFYRVREKYISLWWGLGATYVGNEVDRFGFAYQFGTDIYPVKPVSLHLSFKQSFINENNLNTFKVQGKYHFKNKVIFLGYHYFNLASQEISSPSLGFEIYF